MGAETQQEPEDRQLLEQPVAPDLRLAAEAVLSKARQAVRRCQDRRLTRFFLGGERVRRDQAEQVIVEQAPGAEIGLADR